MSGCGWVDWADVSYNMMYFYQDISKSDWRQFVTSLALLSGQDRMCNFKTFN